MIDARLWLIAAIGLVSAACGEGQPEESDWLNNHLDQGAAEIDDEPSTCVYDLEIDSQARHSDVHEVLSRNKLQACRWDSRWQLVAFRPVSRLEGCRISVVPHVTVRREHDPQSLWSIPDCAEPQLDPPRPEQATTLSAFCFTVKYGHGVAATERQLSGVGSSLFHYAGFPIASVVTASDRVKVWADFRNYPWPDTFTDDVAVAARSAGRTIDFMPCAERSTP